MLGLGTTLNDRYRIDRMLEINALGARYRAFDLGRETQVTITEILPQPGTREEEREGLQLQFEEETQALQNLQHPNIAKIIDYFLMQEAGTSPVPGREFTHFSQPNAYIVTEYVEGESLAQLVERGGAQSEANVLVWAADLLNALDYSHRHDVFHHDIQPKAVIITPDNHAVLVGFEVMGLWKANDPSTWTAKRVMGVPEFASPERWTNQNWRDDPTSDLYSLAATLYTALTGEVPTNAGERMANPYQFIQVKTLSPYVSAQTKDVLMRAMSLARNKRFRNASEMLKTLKSSTHHTRGGDDPAPAPFTSMQQRKSFPWLNFLGMLCSTAVIFAAGLFGPPIVRRFLPQQNAVSRSATPTPTSEMLSLEQELRNDTAATPTRDPGSELVDPTTIVLSTPTAVPDINTILGEQGASAPEDWNVAIDDPFNDNGFGWTIGESTEANAVNRTMENGIFRWEIQPTEIVGRYTTPDNGIAFSDMLVSVHAQLISGPEVAAFGLIIREQNGTYYQFDIRADGFYRFHLWDNAGGATSIIDWSASPSINIAGFNTLSVKAQGNHFELYINDTFVDEAEDNTLAQGNVGIGIITPPYEGTVVFEFDNFMQHTPEEVLIRRSE